MQSSKTLPKTHKGKQIACIELEKSRLLARLIKIIQAITAVLLLIAGGLLMPFSALIELKEPFEHLTVLMLGMIAVSIFQELGRGLLMRIFSGVKPVLRFTGAYLHAGCEAYFNKRDEQILNLVPAVLLTVILIVLFLTTNDDSWRWMIWIILTVDICFGIGYAYASIRFMSMPDDILVQNIGSKYLVYSSKGDAEIKKNS